MGCARRSLFNYSAKSSWLLAKIIDRALPCLPTSHNVRSVRYSKQSIIMILERRRMAADVIHLKNARRSLISPLIFPLCNVFNSFNINHVTTSQFERSQHDRSQAQCSKALRTRRAAQEARSVEGKPKSHWSSQNETGSVSRKVDSLKRLQS